MIRYLVLWAIGLLSTVFSLSGATISSRLVRMGMEEVASVEKDGNWYVTWEDPVYRGTYRGLYEVIRIVLADREVSADVYLVIQKNRIPQVEILLRKDILIGFRDGTLSLYEVMQEVEITYRVDPGWRMLRGVKRENRSAGKIDWVLYPQLSLNNAWFDKLYGTIINIAPALEVGLWKGASFTGQVIFPVWNNMKGQMDYIRPGMLVLRQEIRLPYNGFVTLSGGNFNANRMGVDVSLLYRLDNDRWAFGLNGGLTGSSTFYGGKWQMSRWKKVSGSVGVRYNEPYYNLSFDLKALRCIYGDYGVRADCVRHFGEVSVGLYAMYTGSEANGGFYFAVPLSRKKKSKRSFMRVRLPEYFDLQYEAQSGNEYARRRLGRFYETRPDENTSQRYYNPDFIHDQLMHLAAHANKNKKNSLIY